MGFQRPFLPSAFLSLASCLLVACSSTNQEKAKEQAREDMRKTASEARKAGREIKQDAQDLSRRVDASVQPDSKSASEKMAEAEATAKSVISTTGVRLDHAALLAGVKAKLAANAGLSSLSNIDVAVNGSVVTLTGVVASDDQKKSAELSASQVDGVSKVENHLTVQP